MRFLREKDGVKSGCPQEYQDAFQRFNVSGVGACGRCRYSSGCLSRDALTCARFWMEESVGELEHV